MCARSQRRYCSDSERIAPVSRQPGSISVVWIHIPENWTRRPDAGSRLHVGPESQTLSQRRANVGIDGLYLLGIVLMRCPSFVPIQGR